MKKFLALALALVMALSLAACGSSPAPSSSPNVSNPGGSTPDASTPDNSTPVDSSKPEGGVLVFGTSADYPPFEFHILDENGQDKIVGIDVAVAQKVAEDMGCELKIVDISFENLLTNMGRGDVDFVMAAMELNEERPNAADYSDPYYQDQAPLIVVKKGNEGNFTSLEDFADKTVGAQTATTKADVVNEMMPGARLLPLVTVPELVNNLVYDKCDAVVLDAAVAQKYAETNDQVIILDISLGEAAEPYRAWVAKGDPKGLMDSINATIASLTDEDMAAIVEEANTLSSQAVGE